MADKKWIFVIDTESYAGNFERELTAYCTGQIGECEVGEEASEKAREEIEPEILEAFESQVLQVPDEHGCHRPTSVWETPGWWNDGLGHTYRDSEWGKPHTIEAWEKALVEHKLERSKMGRYPACLSVAVFFWKCPTVDMMNVMRLRAQVFCSSYNKYGHKPIKITGYRLLRETLEHVEISSFGVQECPSVSP